MKTSVGAIIPPFALLVVLLGSSPQWAAAETRTSTFVVDCYDVGQEALQGRPGVLEVTKGWRGAAEINRVVYDHQIRHLQTNPTGTEGQIKSALFLFQGGLA